MSDFLGILFCSKRKTLEIVRFRGFLSVSIWNVVRVIELEPTISFVHKII